MQFAARSLVLRNRFICEKAASLFHCLSEFPLVGTSRMKYSAESSQIRSSSRFSKRGAENETQILAHRPCVCIPLHIQDCMECLQMPITFVVGLRPSCFKVCSLTYNGAYPSIYTSVSWQFSDPFRKCVRSWMSNLRKQAYLSLGPPSPEIPSLKVSETCRMYSPVVTLNDSAESSNYVSGRYRNSCTHLAVSRSTCLDEAIVETEIMPDAVSPAGPTSAEVRVVDHYPLVHLRN